MISCKSRPLLKGFRCPGMQTGSQKSYFPLQTWQKNMEVYPFIFIVLHFPRQTEVISDKYTYDTHDYYQRLEQKLWSMTACLGHPHFKNTLYHKNKSTTKCG